MANPSFDFGTFNSVSASAQIWRPRRDKLTVYIESSAVTTGATVYISVHRLTGAGAGGYYVVHTEAIAATGFKSFQVTGPYTAVQVGISAYTDGTHKITAEAS